MGRYDGKEEYLNRLKEQIRCKKAKNMVAEEIGQHIEDQKASYINEGDDENTAMVKSLEQMGDPIEIGILLDKIHKPRMEWRVLLVVLILCSFGVFAQISIGNEVNIGMISFSNDVGRHILFLALGLLLMTSVYFFDYTKIGKYSKIIWLLLIIGIFLYASFGIRVNGRLPHFHAYVMLFFPVYGGVIYAYKGKGYPGIIKCILFSVATVVVELQFRIQSSIIWGFLLSSIIMLTAAAMKNWFYTSKKITMAIICGWIPVFLTAIILLSDGLTTYQMDRINYIAEVIIHPYEKGFQMSNVRQTISNAKLFGGTTDFMGFLHGVDSNYILTYVIGKWGIVAGTLVVGLFVVFICRILYISYHQKNSLGMFVGLGSSMVFAIQGVNYILSNLGIHIIEQVSLPFISYGGSLLAVNFIVLGIILSVFRNTNIVEEVPYKEMLPINIKKVS